MVNESNVNEWNVQREVAGLLTPFTRNPLTRSIAMAGLGEVIQEFKKRLENGQYTLNPGNTPVQYATDWAQRNKRGQALVESTKQAAKLSNNPTSEKRKEMLSTYKGKSRFSRKRGGRRTVRFAKRKYARKSSRSKYGRKSRRGRGNGGGKKKYPGAAGTAFIGSPGTEDPAVKKHGYKGVQWEYCYSNTITGNHGGYVLHSTMPQKTVLNVACLALVKKIFSLMGISIKDYKDTMILPEFYERIDVKVAFFEDGNTDAESSVTSGIFDLTKTYNELAEGIQASLLTITANQNNALYKMGQLTVLVAETAGLFKPFHILDGDGIKFEIDAVSNLVYQNRSGTDAASTSQDPLFQVDLNGDGQRPVATRNPASAGTDEIKVDWSSGMVGLDFDTNLINYLSDPSKAAYKHVKTVKNDVLSPGVVKQHKLSSHNRISLLRLLKTLTLNGTSTTPSNDRTWGFGKYSYHWFRKTIDFSSANPYTVAWTLHLALGATCLTYKSSRTFPIVVRAS